MTNLTTTGRKWSLSDGTSIIDTVEEYTCTFDTDDAEDYPGLVAGADGWALSLGNDINADSLIPVGVEPDEDLIAELVASGLEISNLQIIVDDSKALKRGEWREKKQSKLQTIVDDGKALKRGEWREKKQFERDWAFQLIDMQAQSTFASPNALYSHFVLQSKLPRLSATNIMLLKAQYPDVSDVERFDIWKKRGRPVRRGEEGLKILDGKEYTKEDGTPAIGYDVGHIFDISQTVGEPPLALDSMSIRANGQMTDYAEMLAAMMDNAPANIMITDLLPEDVPAIYEDNTILVPDISDISDIKEISNSLYALGYGCAAAYRAQQGLPDDPLINACGGILASVYCGTKPPQEALEHVIAQAPSDIRDKKQLLGKAREVGEKLMMQIEKSRDTYRSEHGRAVRDQMNEHKQRINEAKRDR